LNKLNPMFSFIIAVFLFSALVFAALNCAGTSDDDDDEQVATGTFIVGTIEYDGASVGDRIVIAAMPEWPPTGPLWFQYIDMPDTGFPVEYQITPDSAGEYYLACLLDVDPDDTPMNLELDPMPAPTETTVVTEGMIAQADFILLDDAWPVDDDDDDDTVDDDDDDNDTSGPSKLSGTISYDGNVDSDRVVIAFYRAENWPPAGPPPGLFMTLTLAQRDLLILTMKLT